MLWRSTSTFAAVLFLSVGCTPHKATVEYQVRLLVTNVPGDPLAGVSVSLGGQQIGRTGTDGYADLKIPGREGARANLRLECPPNHRQPTDPTVVGLFDYATDSVPEVSAVCQQEHVRQGVVIHTAGAPALPFSVRGQAAGSTDAAGIAHLLTEGEPGETIELKFETTEYPDLRPASPSLNLILGDHDDSVLAEQRFEVVAIKPARGKGRGRPRKPSAPAPSHDGPVRIR